MHKLSSSIAKNSSDEKVRENAGIIYSESDSLMKMASKLKNASEIYAGEMHIQPAAYSFSQLISDVYEEARQAIGEKDITLKTDISPKIPDKLFGDMEHLNHVTVYLLTNSIEHTESGTISLTIFGTQNEDKEHLLISWKDTGRGIDPENLKRLTEHSAEQNESWSFSKQEPGIGLTMIHEMLCLMDSGLNVISEPGEGSEFYFEIDQAIVDPAPCGPLELS
jgi:signal transduction histidine kinase